jgi:hypothetical protein
MDTPQQEYWQPARAQDFIKPLSSDHATIVAVPESEPAPEINGDWALLSLGLFILVILIWMVPTVPEDENED